MITIVIPALNEEKNIGNLLDCIVQQNIEEPLEVVVADAHSTDGTRALVETYHDRLPRLRIVDGGLPAVARNNGAKNSTGDLIFFIDADIRLPQAEFLRVSADYFRSHALAVGTTRLIPNSNKWVDHFLVGVYNTYLPIGKYIWPLGAMCIVASREVFEKTGGYPEDRVICEDHDFVGLCTTYGPYALLPLPVIMSIRRFEKEGRWGVAWKYTTATLYRVIFGPIRKPLFAYEFAYSDHEDRGHKEVL